MAEGMTQAERQAAKTLHGEWRTPIPINFVDDPQRPTTGGKRFYSGAVRDKIRLIVENKEVKVGNDIKMQRHVTLEYFNKDEENDIVLINEEPIFRIQGKANMRYNRIKWDNGCCWTRAGASAKDKDDIKHGRDAKVMEDSNIHSAAPPCDMFDMSEAGPPKRFLPAARHTAPMPDWETQVAEVQRVMIEQLKEIDKEVEMRRRERLDADALAEAVPLESDRQSRASPHPRMMVPEAIHTMAPPEEGQDTEAGSRAGKVMNTDAQHSMFNCCACGNKPKVLEDADEVPEEPLPEARDLSEGFFDKDQVDDIIDRINDVVGIWGISEATERELIKVPVEAMNKLVKGAMNTFLNNPLMDLLAYMMDDSLDFSVKCQAIGHYINEHFVKPLCASLVEALGATFEAISWIKDQVTKVIMMMSQMVTDQVVSKSVEQMNDSDLVD